MSECRRAPEAVGRHLHSVGNEAGCFRPAWPLLTLFDPDQRAKVRLIRDDELEKRMPAREAIVELELTDGTKLTEHITAVRGAADNPMIRQELIAKAQDLIAPVLGTQTFNKLSQKIFEMETNGNIRELRPLLQTA